MKENLNKILLNLWITRGTNSEVDEKDVTVRKADLQRDIRSFISYAVKGVCLDAIRWMYLDLHMQEESEDATKCHFQT